VMPPPIVTATRAPWNATFKKSSEKDRAHTRATVSLPSRTSPEIIERKFAEFDFCVDWRDIPPRRGLVQPLDYVDWVFARWARTRCVEGMAVQLGCCVEVASTTITCVASTSSSGVSARTDDPIAEKPISTPPGERMH
jgi:hypothetical protein